MKPHGKIIATLAFPLLALSACGLDPHKTTSSAPPSTSAHRTADSIAERLRSDSPMPPREDLVVGGTVGSNGRSQQTFTSHLPGPVTARFLCEKGRVTVSFNGDKTRTVDCGEIASISGILPYADGKKDLTLTVEGVEKNAWAVALFPAVN